MTSKTIHSDSDPFLTTSEAAQRLGVTLRTVQLWVDAGKLQAARTPGGHRRIHASDVRALQESMGIKPTREATLLTDDDVRKIAHDTGCFGEEFDITGAQTDKLARAIEAAVLSANGLEAAHA